MAKLSGAMLAKMSALLAPSLVPASAPSLVPASAPTLASASATSLVQLGLMSASALAEVLLAQLLAQQFLVVWCRRQGRSFLRVVHMLSLE